MEIDNTLQILRWYNNVETELLSLLSIVPYNEKNFGTVIPKTAPYIVEAGAILSTVHQVGGQDAKIFNYYVQECKLDQSLLVFIKYPLELLHPFSGVFVDNKFLEPGWWNAYNLLKHDRISNITVANLKNFVDIVSALFLVICNTKEFLDALIIEEKYIGGVSIDYLRNFKNQVYQENVENNHKDIAFESEAFYCEHGPKDLSKIDVTGYYNYSVRSKHIRKYWELGKTKS